MSASISAPARSPAGPDRPRNARDTRHSRGTRPSRDTRNSLEPDATRARPHAHPLLPLGANNSTGRGIATHSTVAAAARSILRNPEPVGGSGGAAFAPPEH
jgi:hypothetical protein